MAHLFYQHHPDAPIWGSMHWGHAVGDLVRWEHRDVAIAPDPVLGTAYSGSGVVDALGATGLCPPGSPCPILVFTHHGGEDGAEKQSPAIGSDDGETLETFAGNPVLADPTESDFRDPRVFPYDGEWRMALAAGDRVRFYRSADLVAWEPTGSFASDALEGVWECPELFELPVAGESGATRHVLTVSVNPGGTGGSRAAYWVGAFDGSGFVPEHEAPRWVDHGADFYAAQSWSEPPDDRRVWIGWMSNWRYALFTPTDPWRGAMTVPRAVSLRRDGDDRWLAQEPVEELAELRGSALVHVEDADLAGALDVPAEFDARALDVVAVLDPGDADEIVFRLRVGGGQETLVGWDVAAGVVYLDRTASGDEFFAGFATRHEAPVEPADGRLTLRVLVDWSSVEVFAWDGRVVLTDLVFPDPDAAGFGLEAIGGTARVEALDVWSMRSIWAPAR